MSVVVACVAALVASALTLFSGFGLGTLLMPVFALFFPVPLAIAATAIVHLANNLFKLALVGRHADRAVLIRFAVPAAIAALAGAGILTLVADWPPWFTWHFAGRTCAVTPVKALIGGLIMVFAMLEFSPAVGRLALPPRYLVVGGLLSGFFGGLSGNQGALRTAFLIKAGLSKQAFIGTGVVAAVIVDFVRLAVYGLSLPAALFEGPVLGIIGPATLAAFLGSWLAARLLTKITYASVKGVVAVFLMLTGCGLASGVL